MSLLLAVLFASLFGAECSRALVPSAVNARLHDKRDSTTRQGWTPQPDGRGTLDILWSCGITMILCSWSILCLNTASQHETKLQVLWRKFAMTVLGILCPEIIFELAIGQFISARKCLNDFKSLNPTRYADRPPWYKLGSIKQVFREEVLGETNGDPDEWTMKKAFYVDMGGCRLYTRDHPPFPLDGKQLYYVISKYNVRLPKFSDRNVDDRNKVDGLLRAVTLCQISWFLISVVARWIQGLAVTVAELTVVSFILCSLGTAVFWWHKPADVMTGEEIVTDLSLNDVLRQEGQDLNGWKRTPLDFINRKEWWWSKGWSNFVHIMYHLRITWGPRAMPIEHIPDTLHRELSIKAIHCVILPTYAFFSILLVGWNYEFPTPIERTLYRAACITMMATLSLMLVACQFGQFYFIFRERIRNMFSSNRLHPPFLEPGIRLKGIIVNHKFSKKINSACDGIRNNSPDNDPFLQMRLRNILSLYFIGSFYLLARAFIIVEDIIELRSLPASAYSSVDWQKFWPHFG